MKIDVLQLLDGAAEAKGITVIIDVFRAFTVEPFVFSRHAASLLAIGEVETARAIKQKNPDTVLIGERHGLKCEGFEFGNSPSAIASAELSGRSVVHTTSAGTQGLTVASNAERIFTGALVNASATARKILFLHPDHVSLVCMGWEGKRPTEEDTLCAEYLRSLLEGHPMKDIQEKAEELKFTEGKKFFDPAQAEAFPASDFPCCIDIDRFDFAIEAIRSQDGFVMKKVR